MVEYNSTSGILRYQEIFVWVLCMCPWGWVTRRLFGMLRVKFPSPVCGSWGRGLKPGECQRKTGAPPSAGWEPVQEVSWSPCAIPRAALLSSSETVFKPFVKKSDVSIHVALKREYLCFHLMRWKKYPFSFEFQVNFKGLWLESVVKILRVTLTISPGFLLTDLALLSDRNVPAEDTRVKLAESAHID